MDARVDLGMIPDRSKHSIHHAYKVLSQFRPLPLVPAVCPFDVGSCLWADLKPGEMCCFARPTLAGRQARPRRRVLTSSQGTLVSGCAW
ncbi:hypothetical protein BH23GEM5_BH23GEM5_11080 [soil metagenome]